MYIQEVRVTVCCENPACAKQIKLWPRVRDDNNNILAIDRDNILQTARRKGLIVMYGVIFCSETCEKANRNTEIKS